MRRHLQLLLRRAIRNAARLAPEPPPSASIAIVETHNGHMASALQRLSDSFARLRVKRPEILHASSRKPLLEDRQMRVPSAPEILGSDRTDDSTVRQDQARLLTFGD